MKKLLSLALVAFTAAASAQDAEDHQHPEPEKLARCTLTIPARLR